MKGFALNSGRSEKEEKSIALYASWNSIPCKHFTSKDIIPEDYIPIGTTEWFEHVTGWKIKPDNYPDFLSDWFKRKIWNCDKWPLGEKVFIKPSDSYKRFNGRITNGSYKGKKKGPYLCSEIVEFTNEWRYYISKGKVVYSSWYMGSDEDELAPELNIEWPENWVGSADFGKTSDRGIALVEAHHPFSVGNYMRLNDFKIYSEWVIDGWEYLKSLKF